MNDFYVPGGGGYDMPEAEDIRLTDPEPEVTEPATVAVPKPVMLSDGHGQWETARRMYGTFHEGRMSFGDADEATQEAWLRVAGTQGLCEAKLANLERAVEGMQNRMSAMVEGVNLLGTQYNTFVEFITNFQAQMSQGGGIMGMMKALKGGK